MSIDKTLGGDRLGSGNKMKVKLKGFQRSTHDIGSVWRSTLAPGVLIPFMQKYALNGDNFIINLNTMVRTLPTNVPLFGSFKMQLDIFQVPIRLYINQLKNNKLNVGMNMQNIALPMIELYGSRNQVKQFSQSSLNAYLGIRGIGRTKYNKRQVNALGHLAYLDIFKNYYANKQEEFAYVISDETVSGDDKYLNEVITAVWSNNQLQEINTLETNQDDLTNPPALHDISYDFEDYEIKSRRLLLNKDALQAIGIDIEDLSIYTEFRPEQGYTMWNDWMPVDFWYNIEETTINGIEYWILEYIDRDILPGWPKMREWWKSWAFPRLVKNQYNEVNVGLEKFKLENIDDIIEKASRNDNVIFTDEDKSPIRVNSAKFYNTEKPLANKPLNGLLVKTYQSDVFNNWVQTEWITGENGINAITAVDTSEGNFTMDTLNLAQKVYDMLNRIAVSGGTYEDWQEAVWGEKVVRQAQTPIYLGGASTEIVFDEVVSTAQTERDLGAVAGKGTQSGLKGGYIDVDIKEPSIIMGIVSLTPRIDYSQGNEWFINLKNMDNFHKPSLDGIGFQELITEQMSYWDAVINNDDEEVRFSAGKQPAWINYMTDVNKTYGLFAEDDGMMFMTLNRKYEIDEEASDNESAIKDLTTYIDPSKYNDAFTNSEITAQNFWVQISADIKARRKMSAKIIPNL